MTTQVEEFHAIKFFDGDNWKENVCIRKDHITKEIISISSEGFDTSKAVPLIVPTLIDIQIYGAYGCLLSEFPEPETIRKIGKYCLDGGAFYFQPTIASQTLEVIFKVIDAVREYMSNGGVGCIGLHLEGPWINAVKRGAHEKDIVRSPTLDEVRVILDRGKGVISMITVAPEVCSPETIEYIHSQGIVISAGHSDATYQQAMHSFRFITTATHLYNAMSPFQHRAPGLVGAILNHDSVMSSIVVDGYHVDWAAVEMAKKIMKERLFCITDAVTETSTGPYRHYLAGDKYENQGILSGSALTQLKSVRNLVNHVGIELGEAIRMCSVYPARVMNRPGINGKIIVGETSSLLSLTEDLSLLSYST
jgi:N-acetylglucosamine-6-phosphate deacetylase